MGAPIAVQGTQNIHQETMVSGYVLQPYNNQSAWQSMYPYNMYQQGIFPIDIYQQGVTANPNPHGVYSRGLIHPYNFVSSQHQGISPTFNMHLSQQVENYTFFPCVNFHHISISRFKYY
ncbi:hypothetical protein MKX01_027168 [Papaver californicum]|nr:hypothetical protein MKX01_027168 [Papaver californicum]